MCLNAAGRAGISPAEFQNGATFPIRRESRPVAGRKQQFGLRLNGAKLSIATATPTPRFADPSKEGMLLADNRLFMIPSSGGGDDVPSEVPTSLSVGTKQGGRGGWDRLYP